MEGGGGFGEGLYLGLLGKFVGEKGGREGV
jgi:hypothetical protein